MEKIAVLVLAKRVENKDFSLNSSPSPLMSLGTGLVVEKITNVFADSDKFVLYMALGIEDIDLTEYKVFDKYKIIPVATNSPCETVYYCTKQISENWIHILPISTVPIESCDSAYQVFVEKNLRRKFNWSAFKINNESILPISKFSFLEKKLNAFTGRFTSKKEYIVDTFKKMSSPEKLDLISFVSSDKILKKENIIYCDWIDLGHIDSISISRKYSFRSRAFNSLILEESEDIIQKISLNAPHLRDQCNFINNLSPDLKVFFPQVVSHNFLEENKSYVARMEYLAMPNLSELFISSNLSERHWNLIFMRLFDFVKKISLYSYEFKEENSNFQSFKLKNRFKTMLGQLRNSEKHYYLKNILEKSFTINNYKAPPLKEIFEFLYSDLLMHEKDVNNVVSHGDLCFNNILYDPYSNRLKLVDPKGLLSKFNKLVAFDKNYDLAKLNHSINGGYDSIIYGLYSLKKSSNNFSLNLFSPPALDLVNSIFKDYVRKTYPEFICKSPLLTASLFLSMIPLHIEDEERALIFALVGSKLYMEYKTNSNSNL